MQMWFVPIIRIFLGQSSALAYKIGGIAYDHHGGLTSSRHFEPQSDDLSEMKEPTEAGRERRERISKDIRTVYPRSFQSKSINKRRAHFEEGREVANLVSNGDQFSRNLVIALLPA